MKIAIYGQSFNENTKKSTFTLLDLLLYKKVQVFLANDFLKELKKDLISSEKYNDFTSFI